MTTSPDPAQPPAPPQDAAPSNPMPDGLYIAMTGGYISALTPDGEVISWTISNPPPFSLSGGPPIITILAPRLTKILNIKSLPAFDVLELFAFICPATFCAPTIKGLCSALNLAPPQDEDEAPMALMDIIGELYALLRRLPEKQRQSCLEIAAAMGRQGSGWAWTPFIFAALGEEYNPDQPVTPKDVMAIWKDLPEWAEDAPKTEGAHYPLSEEEALSTLTETLQNKTHSGHAITPRPAQQSYTKLFSRLYSARDDRSDMTLITAEAGTGVGKTLGYLSPAKGWAEKNEQAVWVSTYTKNLQRQMDQEMTALYPDAAERSRKAVIRKGRENYLCLLNLEELIGSAALSRTARPIIAAGLMARWASASKDGDMTGNDFPGWLSLLLGYQDSYGLTDKRGECIYSACDHYHKCFIERTVRKSKHARIVVANHALVMIQSAMATMDDDMPSRVIFDEGHHLFDAADSAFAAHLSGQEMMELRRWVIGPESEKGGRRAGRAKGLKKRLEDLVAGNEEADDLLQQTIRAATCLAGPGWLKRLSEGDPFGKAEAFLMAIYKQVDARQTGQPVYYSIETDVFPLSEDVIAKATDFRAALQNLATPMKALAKHFLAVMDDNAGHMEGDTRRRMDAAVKGLMRRSDMTLGAWLHMLDLIISGTDSTTSSDAPQDQNFADWFEITRSEGRVIDIGMFRHYIDPMKPFAQCLKPHLHGLAVTSATLRADSLMPAKEDTSDDNQSDLWGFSDLRTGSHYLATESAPQRLSLPSPYDYAAQTKILVINDVNKNDGDAVSTAFRELFLAAHGGALGIFTSIQRLKYVQSKIVAPLAEGHIPLYSQHVDDMDIGTLIDMFREDEHSCLLGTDAVRDGVDVPGRSLRLLIFDRVPWPRPNILHRKRKAAFGSILGSTRAYDEALTRLKLKQAYGRLIRSETDKGVFVMLDSALPSRLKDAFPQDVTVEKCSLADACGIIRGFLPSE